MRKIFLLVILSVMLLGGIGLFLWTMTREPVVKPLPGTLTAEELLEYTVETEEITTNLKSGNYVQLQFQIQGDSKKAKEELNNRMFQIRQIIIQTVTSMEDTDIKGAEGITRLEQTLMSKINQLMLDGQVMKIFTTKMMIQ